jgi:hypothetical protein
MEVDTEEATMAKYLIKASYSPDGLKGVMKAGGTSRVTAEVDKAMHVTVDYAPPGS